MNREEAQEQLTEWLEQMRNHGVPNWSAKLTALDMAIKALNDWTEYSDKLWKIAYERGKAEEWIPCDEKLPSESGEYLVSYVLLNDEICTGTAHYGKPLLPLNTNETECGWYKTDGDGDYYIDDILAWQPLPKPYKAEQQTEPKSSICTRCENKDFCKETLRIYGLPNMRVEECKEYREKPIPTSLLNSEPTVSHEEAWAEPSDLISRAEAIKAVEQEYRIDRGYMVDDYTYGFNQAIDYISDIVIAEAPSVSAECVGEWIFKTNIICGNGREGAGYVCSVCGVDFFHVDGMKYCPNCGAKMKGGAE